MTLRAGLTGGIACGKSRVLRRLSAAGLFTLDLDLVAHEATAPGGSAYREVVEAFGSSILAGDGSVDRRRLGALVFADPAVRARLNAIVHPRVRDEEARRVALLPDDPAQVAVTDAALLVEAGVHLRFDRLVVVSCAPAEQVRRLMERDGLDEKAARARVDAQMPIGEKRRFAHLEVDTSGSLAETDRAADALADELRRLARSRPAPVHVPLERRVGAMVSGPRRPPRGLDPDRILADIAAGGGLEMERVARLLVPPTDRPWYRASEPREDAGPETLVAPVVVWSLARGGPDLEFVAAAAASLARLTHTDGSAIAGACLFALALMEALVTGASSGLLASLPGWTDLARNWGGAAPPDRIVAAVARPDPASDDLAGVLAAAAAGLPTANAPRTLLDALAALDPL